MDHLFLSCPFANAMWLGSSLNIKSDLQQPISIIHWVQQWLLNIEKLRLLNPQFENTLAVKLWSIWKSRNQLPLKVRPPTLLIH